MPILGKTISWSYSFSSSLRWLVSFFSSFLFLKKSVRKICIRPCRSFSATLLILRNRTTDSCFRFSSLRDLSISLSASQWFPGGSLKENNNHNILFLIYVNLPLLRHLILRSLYEGPYSSDLNHFIHWFLHPTAF